MSAKSRLLPASSPYVDSPRSDSPKESAPSDRCVSKSTIASQLPKPQHNGTAVAVMGPGCVAGNQLPSSENVSSSPSANQEKLVIMATEESSQLPSSSSSESGESDSSCLLEARGSVATIDSSSDSSSYARKRRLSHSSIQESDSGDVESLPGLCPSPDVGMCSVEHLTGANVGSPLSSSRSLLSLALTSPPFAASVPPTEDVTTGTSDVSSSVVRHALVPAAPVSLASLSSPINHQQQPQCPAPLASTLESIIHFAAIALRNHLPSNSPSSQSTPSSQFSTVSWSEASPAAAFEDMGEAFPVDEVPGAVESQAAPAAPPPSPSTEALSNIGEEEPREQGGEAIRLHTQDDASVTRVNGTLHSAVLGTLMVDDRMVERIDHSFKYQDDVYEYRYVVLPRGHPFLSLDPSASPRNRLLQESEWRQMGIRQTRGWEHYCYSEYEPNILMFRRPLETNPQSGQASVESKLRVAQRMQVLHSARKKLKLTGGLA